MSGTGLGQALGGFGRKDAMHGGIDCRDKGVRMLWSWSQNCGAGRAPRSCHTELRHKSTSPQ